MVLARVSVRRGLAAASPKFRRVTEALQCKAERACREDHGDRI